MNLEQKNNPLHGKTLEFILETIVEKYTWKELYQMLPIQCFFKDPSLKSSLKFLRKTEWARKRVEAIYIYGPPRNYFKKQNSK